MTVTAKVNNLKFPIYTAHYNNRRGLVFSFGAATEEEARARAGRLTILTGWTVVRLHSGDCDERCPQTQVARGRRSA